ncbi:MAG: hypothetical protein ACRDSH_06285 [Pseudonocardiaceae bacterium]
MKRDQLVKVAKSCGHVLGVGNLLLLGLGGPTAVTLGLVVVLAPFTLAVALKLTVFLACSVVSFALGDHRERAELLVCAISRMQPPSEGEQYQEAMLAEIRAAPSSQLPAIRTNLVTTAPSAIAGAWIRLPKPRWKRARKR